MEVKLNMKIYGETAEPHNQELSALAGPPLASTRSSQSIGAAFFPFIGLGFCFLRKGLLKLWN
jgi:hypothetical protein